jgi:hypothetical protein
VKDISGVPVKAVKVQNKVMSRKKNCDSPSPIGVVFFFLTPERLYRATFRRSMIMERLKV